MPIGNSDKIQIGDWVLAVGAPEGLPHTVTAGIISAKGRTSSDGYQTFLQTDAAINPGNSGGPLANMMGEVIGINTAIISPSGANEGIGLVIPSNTAKIVMKQLIEKGKVIRGYLGIEIEEKQNQANAPVVSTDTGRVSVRIINTDEEWMIAKTVSRILNLNIKMEHNYENKKSVREKIS